MSSSCSSVHKNDHTPRPAVYSGAAHVRPHFDKNKEMTAAGFSARSSVALAGSRPAGEAFTCARHCPGFFFFPAERRQGDIRLLLCDTQTRPRVESIIQWKKQELQEHILLTLESVCLCSTMRRWAARHAPTKITGGLNGD